MNHPPLPAAMPNVIDLAAHARQAAEPKPVDAEQVVVRSFRLDSKAQLPPSMPVLGGRTAMGDEFALTFNPKAGELYLLHEARDHRIIGLGILADEWIKAAGGMASPDRPRILSELDAAIVAIDTARLVDDENADVTLDEALDNTNAAIASIESALRLARTLRANLDALPKTTTAEPVE